MGDSLSLQDCLNESKEHGESLMREIETLTGKFIYQTHAGLRRTFYKGLREANEELMCWAINKFGEECQKLLKDKDKNKS